MKGMNLRDGKRGTGEVIEGIKGWGILYNHILKSKRKRK